jgi:hypothetical protein
MSEDHSHHPQTAGPTNLADQQAQDAQYLRRVLLELIDMGTDIARRVHRQSQSQAPQPAGDNCPEQNLSPSHAEATTIAFDRITRTIRRTVALFRKLSEPVKAPTFGATHHQMAPRRRNIRVVNDSFQRDQAEDDLAKCSDAELQDRLDALDLEDDPADRPVADIVADICCDLGIAQLPDKHPQKPRLLADIANLARRAALIIPPKPQASRDPPGLPAVNIPALNVPALNVVLAMHPHNGTAGVKSTDPPEPSG